VFALQIAKRFDEIDKMLVPRFGCFLGGVGINWAYFLKMEGKVAEQLTGDVLPEFKIHIQYLQRLGQNTVRSRFFTDLH